MNNIELEKRILKLEIGKTASEVIHSKKNRLCAAINLSIFVTIINIGS